MPANAFCMDAAMISNVGSHTDITSFPSSFSCSLVVDHRLLVVGVRLRIPVIAIFTSSGNFSHIYLDPCLFSRYQWLILVIQYQHAANIECNVFRAIWDDICRDIPITRKVTVKLQHQSLPIQAFIIACHIFKKFSIKTMMMFQMF